MVCSLLEISSFGSALTESTPSGGYANETDIDNTYDPAPFLGVTRNAAGVLTCEGRTDP